MKLLAAMIAFTCIFHPSPSKARPLLKASEMGELGGPWKAPGAKMWIEHARSGRSRVWLGIGKERLALKGRVGPLVIKGSSAKGLWDIDVRSSSRKPAGVREGRRCFYKDFRLSWILVSDKKGIGGIGRLSADLFCRGRKKVQVTFPFPKSWRR